MLLTPRPAPTAVDEFQCFAHMHLALPATRANSMKKGELRATISRGYREISELTKVKCGGDKCPGMGDKAYRCCDQLHCQMTIDHAYKAWGIRLPTTGHQFPVDGSDRLHGITPFAPLVYPSSVPNSGDRFYQRPKM